MQLCSTDSKKKNNNIPIESGDDKTYHDDIVNAHHVIDRKLDMNTII